MSLTKTILTKIGFKNGSQPALNDTNLNQMQTNIQTAISSLETNIEEAINNAIKLILPIGATYITQTDTNPNAILGFGTWERIKGKVLVGLDEDDTDFNEIGKEDGEKTHTLTVNEMPSHNHEIGLTGGSETGSAISYVYSNEKRFYSGQDILQVEGGDQPHNNLQPYRVVGYMWERTA